MAARRGDQERFAPASPAIGTAGGHKGPHSTQHHSRPYANHPTVQNPSQKTYPCKIRGSGWGQALPLHFDFGNVVDGWGDGSVFAGAGSC